MRHPRDLPLRRKMVLMLLAASVAALFSTGVGIVVYELTVFRPRVEANLHDALQIANSDLRFILDFGTPEEGEGKLEELARTTEIRRACLFDEEGDLFASYRAPGLDDATTCPEPPEGDRSQVGGLLTLRLRLIDDAEFLGELVVERHLPGFWTRLGQYGPMIGGVIFALLAVSLILSATLERLISSRIQALARAAREVRDREDSTVRVKDHGHDEIGELTEAFNEMLEAIAQREVALKEAGKEHEVLQEQLIQAQKMESIGRLAGGVAHDFNNFLTVIVGSNDLSLQMLPEDSPLRPILENTRQATEHAADLTRRLLAFARKQIIQPRVIDPHQLIFDVERMLRGFLDDHIELSVIPHGSSWPIRSDPNQLTQVLMNLTANARDAMPDGGTVTIETRNTVLSAEDLRDEPELSPGAYVLLSVQDTGSGMSAEVRRHLFEPFFTTKEQGKGTGLGLAMCYGFVKQSGGHIRVESELGRGSRFNIYLPRAEEGMDSEAAALASEVPPRGDETILVVEDDPLVRRTSVGLLRAQGYTVLEAASGRDALSLASEHSGTIHLLLTDVVMPRMGGPEVAECLKSMRPEIAVLYVTGYSDLLTEKRGELPENVELLQKPYPSATLMRRIRRILDQGPPATKGSESSATIRWINKPS